MSLFSRKKSLDVLMAQAGDSEKGLKRTLGAGSLIALVLELLLVRGYL